MKFHKFFALQNLICLALFIVLLIVCMLLYPGGARFKPEATHYLFFENFISHLGKQTTSSGQDNSFAALLFKAGIYIISGSFALLFVFQPLLFEKNKLSYRLSITASILALCSALAFLGIGYYSADPSTIDIHLVFVKTSFYLFFLSALAQSIAIKKTPFFNKKLFYSYLFFTVGLLFYNLLIEFGPKPNVNPFSLILQVTAQKIIALLFIVNFIFQGFGTLNMLKSKAD